MKVAIALKNSHSQWQVKNANNKEMDRKRIKAPPRTMHTKDTDNCVEERKDDKNDKRIMKEKQLANFQVDKTKVSDSFDEEKRKMFAKFK